MVKLTKKEHQMLIISKDTSAKKKYLKNFNIKMENKIKTRHTKDNFIQGMQEDPIFWGDIYDDTHILENGYMPNIKPRIGKNYQVDII